MAFSTQTLESKMIFEFPLNERFRTFLRIENLYQRWHHYMHSDHKEDHHTALLTLLDLYDFTFRNDIKGDLLSELNRYKQSLSQYYGSPEISEEKLTQTILQMVDAQKQIEQSPKFGSNLVENEWLLNVKSRLVVPSGVCSFDMGFYYQWLQDEPAQRRADMERWEMPFAPLFDAVVFLLSIARNMAFNKECVTLNKVFQQPLFGRKFDILQIEIENAKNCLPDISANKHVIWLRFTPPALQARPKAGLERVPEEIHFNLGLCGAPGPSTERQQPRQSFGLV
jgi:cell division protein ZapD